MSVGAQDLSFPPAATTLRRSRTSILQPHGRLAVLGAEGQVRAWSENWQGRPEVESALDRLRPALRRVRPGELPAYVGRLQLDGRTLDAVAHARDGSVLVDLEPRSDPPTAEAPIYRLARQYLPGLQKSSTIEELAQLTADQMRQLTGFGRALVCRSDENGHEEVLAESRAADENSHLGHWFAATYSSWTDTVQVRAIPDAGASPVALVSDGAGDAGALDLDSLDLAWSALRGIHSTELEHLRARGATASISVPVLVRGDAWGRVLCFDRSPHQIGFELRAACEHLGRLLSLQVEARESQSQASERLELRELILDIVSHLADSDATLQRLVAEPVPLLRVARASGAAVVLNEQVWTVGDTPDEARIAALARWLATQPGETFATDSLARDFAPAAAWPQCTSGVLSIPISQIHQHLVIWFRPERSETIHWAGGRTEQVRGHSVPWNPSEIAAAAELRHALIAIVLRRAEEMADVAAELRRVNKELEAFSYTVSHDLRAPMRHIAGYVDLVQDLDGKSLSERSRRYLANVRQAAEYAGQLTDALLDFSRMGRAELKRAPVNTQLLVQEVVAEFRRHEGARRVQWQIAERLPSLRADPFLMQVVVRNLVGNAVKYSRTREVPRIRIEAVDQPDAVGLLISDNGVGFQQKYIGKLFGVFQRLHRAEEFEGTGIGLASVRRIVERHGGTVWGAGELDRGASFGFSIPRESQPDLLGHHGFRN